MSTTLSTSRTKRSSYEIWRNMKQRCTNQNRPDFKHYGGRGITLCEKWKSFDGFYDDMGEREKGMQIDRMDNEKGYYKDNCRWTTPAKNSLNRRVIKKSNLPKGVSKNHNRFTARIQINEFTYHVGSYLSPKEANNAFRDVFYEWYGESAPVEVANE